MLNAFFSKKKKKKRRISQVTSTSQVTMCHFLLGMKFFIAVYTEQHKTEQSVIAYVPQKKK